MKGIKLIKNCLIAIAFVEGSVNAIAGDLSLKHNIKNKKAIVRAVKKAEKIAFSIGMEALYSDGYISALKSGRKRPSYITDNEQADSYDFKSHVTIAPSRDIFVKHSNDFLNDNHFRDTTEISYNSSLIGKDINSNFKLSYDSKLDAATIETGSVMIGPIADLGYTMKDGMPATVFASKEFESSHERIDVEYIPTVKYFFQESDHYLFNEINTLIRFKYVDFELGLNELLTGQSGSYYSRNINISSGDLTVGVTSRELETDTWKNGNTLYWKNRIKWNNGPSDLSVKTSYSLSDDSDEKRFYIKLIWGE